jgi:hypothetical protein
MLSPMMPTPLRRLRRRGGASYGSRSRAPMLLVVGVLGLLAAACGSTSASPSAVSSSAGSSQTATMTEYVAGHWVSFTAAKRLSPAQWTVVDAYANFSSAALAVYATRSVAPLATVVSAQSKVTAMFTRDLASGTNPEALYTTATVESVAIHGCRASLTLELRYPGGRSLHYVSSWVRPFDRAALANQHGKGPTARQGGSLTSLAATQYAPWLFVGDNRVGGVDTPCGI